MAVWAVGSAYENYVGRWSRRVAVEFLRWLGVPGGRRWLDVGCAMSLPANRRDALRDLLRERLPAGPIPLTARVWAVRGGARAES